jgi:hypothetical protein
MISTRTVLSPTQSTQSKIACTMQSPEDAARVVAIVAHYDGAKLGARDRGPCRRRRSRLREAEDHGSLGQIPTAQFVLVIGTVLGTIALLWVASRTRVGGSLGLSLFQALLTVITVAMLLAYQPLTRYVHHIMPEVLYALLAVLFCLSSLRPTRR